MSTANPVKVPTRRNTELALIVVALLVLFVFETAVEVQLADQLGSTAYALVAAIAALLVVAHILVRIFAPYADPVLLPVTGLLTGIGVVFIRRLDLSSFNYVDGAKVMNFPTEADRANAGWFGWEFPGEKQLVYFMLAVLMFVLVLWFVRDHRNLARYPFLLGLIGLVALASPIVPGVGMNVNGSRLWLNLGVITLQPSEFAKLLLLIFFAYYLVRKREVLSLASKKFLGVPFPRLKDFVPIIAVWVASLVIMVGLKDLGTSLLFFGLFVALLYIATRRISWIIIGLSLFVVGVLSMYPFFAHLQTRVSIWLDPFSDANGEGRQLVQSLIGLGSGGMFGYGPGAGQPQETNPAANSDFVLAGLGEELGMFGLAGIVMLYLLLVSRGMRAALGVKDSFGKLLAGGLAFSIAFQVFVVLGGVTKLIPLTGQTAPFLAAGGSSLMANWVLVAMLVRVSDSARRPKGAPAGPIKVAPPPAPVDDSPTQIVSVQEKPSSDPTELIAAPGSQEQQAEQAAPDPSPPSGPSEADQDAPPTSPEMRKQ